MDDTVKAVTTYTCDIEIAGDLATIKHTCRHFTARGDGKLCVRITEADFVYSGSSQTGATVHFINYPRFPHTPEQLLNHAKKLAELLLTACCQRSCTIVCAGRGMDENGRAMDQTLFIQNKNIPIA